MMEKQKRELLILISVVVFLALHQEQLEDFEPILKLTQPLDEFIFQRGRKSLAIRKKG